MLSRSSILVTRLSNSNYLMGEDLEVATEIGHGLIETPVQPVDLPVQRSAGNITETISYHSTAWAESRSNGTIDSTLGI